MIQAKDRNGNVVQEGNEWGEFLHRKGDRFYDFSKIRKEIEA
jgi:hypothetical protein